VSFVCLYMWTVCGLATLWRDEVVEG
jgi:hypothetical protein